MGAQKDFMLPGVGYPSYATDRDLCSTPALIALLRPWIRRFTTIISAWWLRTSSKN